MSLRYDVIRGLSHDNIIAYRGTGYVTSERLQCLVPGEIDPDECGLSPRFLIMEYIERNLDNHVERSKTPDAPVSF